MAPASEVRLMSLYSRALYMVDIMYVFSVNEQTDMAGIYMCLCMRVSV